MKQQPMPLPKHCFSLLSGGIDSVTLHHDLLSQDWYVHDLIFDYGQRHIKEIQFAKQHCEQTRMNYTIVELHRIRGLFQRSILTDGKGDVIVPNRNATFLNIAAAMAVGAGASSIFIASNKDDGEKFPDCRKEFFESLNCTLHVGGTHVEVCAPYVSMTKRQIVERARSLGVDLSQTWSCYESGSEPCGKCLACEMRRKAME